MPETRDSSPGTVTVTWIGHSTVLIELDGIRLLTDPLLRRRVAHLRRASPLDAQPSRVDAVLISHAHHDHLDRPSLASLGPDQRIVAPRGIGPLLRRWRFRNVEQVRAGDEIQMGAVVIRATPADHSGARFGPLGMRGQGPEDVAAVGYLVAGRRHVYFAGDTDLFPGMSDLASDLDLALLPVWGWGGSLGPGHMDPVRAAEALRLLRPKVAVPIHWGTLSPLWRRPAPDSRAEPALAFQRHAHELAPFVEVRVLAPGGTTAL